MRIKLTKNELRAQQKSLGQFNRYLPTLQLKKAMLQFEVNSARLEIERCNQIWKSMYSKVEDFSSLLSEFLPIHPSEFVKVKELSKQYVNLNGVEVPVFGSIQFEEVSYHLFDLPPWFEGVVSGIQSLYTAKIQVEIAKEKKDALELALRMVSIRVNLFEKILIPRSLVNIKKIKVFLGDQELAAVSRAKVAKNKIESKKDGFLCV